MASLMETISDKLSLAIEKPSFRLSFSSYELKIFSFLKKQKTNQKQTNKQQQHTCIFVQSNSVFSTENLSSHILNNE